jgi:hypothetical protein
MCVGEREKCYELEFHLDYNRVIYDQKIVLITHTHTHINKHTHKEQMDVYNNINKLEISKPTEAENVSAQISSLAKNSIVGINLPFYNKATSILMLLRMRF